MKLSLKAYENAASKDQRMQMRPIFRSPPAKSEFTPVVEVPKSYNIYFESSSCIGSNICFGDARVFSGQEQFRTSYSKNYSVYSSDDALYTSPVKTPRPSAPSPVQNLMFRFAQKVAASRVAHGGAGGRGGKSSLRRSFESIDTNGDRRITITELEGAIEKMGFPTPPADVLEGMFKIMAADNKDYVDYISFCRALEGVPEHLRASW